MVAVACDVGVFMANALRLNARIQRVKYMKDA
jgi:hypothetical protein